MKNNFGFSLVEVMITVGLLSMVGLFVMKQQESSTKVQTKMSIDQEISGLTNQIGKVLSRGDNCTVNLKGAGLGQSLTEIDSALRLPDGSLTRVSDPLFKKGTILGSRRLQIAKIEYKELKGVRVSGPFTISEVIAVAFEYGKSTDPNRPTTNLAQTVTKNFFIQTEKDAANKVTKCLSENDNLETEALRSACLALSASFDPATNKCTFDSILPACILTSEPCTSYFPRQENMNIAVQIQGRRSCTSFYDHRVDPCFYYRADDVSCNWPGNCECTGAGACTCFEGINHQCFLQNIVCTDIDEVQNQTFNYCCR